MDHTLALQFLSIAFLLLMNVHDTGARNIKVELQNEKQGEWYKVTPVSDDESYGEGYITISKSTKPNYKASFHFYKTSDAYKSDQPDYSASYLANTRNSNKPYIAGYRKTSDAHKSDQPDYSATYLANTRDSNKPYIAGYRKTSDAHKFDQPDYSASYLANTRDSNKPYIAGYRKTSDAHKSDQSDYSASYLANTRDSNAPYIAAYKKTSNAHKSDQPDYASYLANTHDSSTPYIAGYRKTSDAHKSDQLDYSVSYLANTRDSNAPYIAGYRKIINAHKSNKPDYSASYLANTHDSNAPYITKYCADCGPKNDQKESANIDHTGASYLANTRDSNAPYIANYQKTSDAHKSDQPDYSASYLANTHDSNAPYITQYGGDSSLKNDQKESVNIDHTEAFKTGFFAVDDLYVGNVMTLQFPIQEVSHFLPRKEAESIPFSTSQLSSIFQLFSIPEDSPEANAIRDTVGQCEGEPITGETKICATSLESMLEFVSSIIGSKAKHNILTTSYPTTSSVPLQKYTILEVSKDINASKWVACHPLPYPYALYYCHFIATGSKVFKVSLSGENDNKIEALGICHLDTSSWDPNHVVFKQLGITAGKDPVCHFFPVKHLMWVPQPSQATM